MAKKETLKAFVKNLGKFDDLTQKEALKVWGQETESAMGRAIHFAPQDKGTLRGKARLVRAKLTANGIKSAFIVGVPYAAKLELDKSLNIKTTVNPFAQSGYARRGVEEREPFFIKGLNIVISKAWNRI